MNSLAVWSKRDKKFKGKLIICCGKQELARTCSVNITAEDNHSNLWPCDWCDIYLINQARGPYWENIGPRTWQYGPSEARSVQKRPRAIILPVRSRARLVNRRFITWLKKADCREASAESFGTMPGPILREYCTGNRAFWLVDSSYWPSDCLSRAMMLLHLHS